MAVAEDFVTVSTNPAIQLAYEQMRIQGQSHAIADLLAHRQFCGVHGTEQDITRGWGNDPVPGVADVVKKRTLELARQAGIDTGGKTYISTIADHRGPMDPAAWANGHIHDHVKAVCKARNLTCTAKAARHTGYIEPAKEIPLAEDIIQRRMVEAATENPRQTKNLRKLREEVIEKHTPKWGK